MNMGFTLYMYGVILKVTFCHMLVFTLPTHYTDSINHI